MINYRPFSVTTTRIYLHSRNLLCYYHQSDTRHFVFYNIKHLLMGAILRSIPSIVRRNSGNILEFIIWNTLYFVCTYYFCCSSHICLDSRNMNVIRAKVNYFDSLVMSKYYYFSPQVYLWTNIYKHYDLEVGICTLETRRSSQTILLRVYAWLYTRFGMMNRYLYIDHLEVVTINDYNSVTISTLYSSLDHMV